MIVKIELEATRENTFQAAFHRFVSARAALKYIKTLRGRDFHFIACESDYVYAILGQDIIKTNTKTSVWMRKTAPAVARHCITDLVGEWVKIETKNNGSMSVTLLSCHKDGFYTDWSDRMIPYDDVVAIRKQGK